MHYRHIIGLSVEDGAPSYYLMVVREDEEGERIGTPTPLLSLDEEQARHLWLQLDNALGLGAERDAQLAILKLQLQEAQDGLTSITAILRKSGGSEPWPSDGSEQ